MSMLAKKTRRAQIVHRAPTLKCPVKGCPRWLRNHSGLTKHINTIHEGFEAKNINKYTENRSTPLLSSSESKNAELQFTEDEDITMDSGISENHSNVEIQHMEEENMDLVEEKSPGYASALCPSGIELSSEGNDGEYSIMSTSSAAGPKHASPRRRKYHTFLTGTPCDAAGNDLPPGTDPPPRVLPTNKWEPFKDQLDFEIVDFLYRQNQMPQRQQDHLSDLWGASLRVKDPNAEPPFANHKDLLDKVDSIKHGEVSWDSFELSYTGSVPEEDPPSWMLQKYTFWHRDVEKVAESMLKNRDFDGEIDYAPYKDYNDAGERRWKDLMSGDWAWKQADLISKVPGTRGCTFVPLVAGSDKTTVSVATGQNEYYPLYMSLGNVHNSVRRAHRGAVAVVAFLAIPKSDRKHDNNPAFRTFRRHLFHSALSRVFSSVRGQMTKPKVMECPDGHKRRVIFGLGPYIADYPEQVLLAGVLSGWCARCLSPHSDLDKLSNWRRQDHSNLVISMYSAKHLEEQFGLVKDVVPYTNDFTRSDIHELLAPDLLHQIIKGTFKDHLVTWVEKFLKLLHGSSGADVILDEIDHRLALVPHFSGLRRFPQGRRFKQWTGDDSKALMKVYLPAIVGHLPTDIVKTFRYFLEFCYLVRRSVFDESTLKEVDESLTQFHKYREVFIKSGVRKNFSLPRQHSLVHYHSLIRSFGAPNGLCSSITESKHIEAVKKPWRRSNRYNALIQMLTTNGRLEKLQAARNYFEKEGMLQNIYSNARDDHSPEAGVTAASDNEENLEDDEEYPEDGDLDGPTIIGCVTLANAPQRGYACFVEGLAKQTGFVRLPFLIKKFLYRQLHPEFSQTELPEDFRPELNFRIDVFHSATATYYAPSDPSGVGGMRREIIRSTRSWRKGKHRYDTIFVETDSEQPGMRGLHVARSFLFFGFTFDNVTYPCALVQWFEAVDDMPDEETGMWIVEPEFLDDDEPSYSVIHIDCIVRAAHLIPVFGESLVPANHELDPSETLDNFSAFYVNKYVDHHAHELAF